jgi:simple sugar transport system substrate-binding protein
VTGTAVLMVAGLVGGVTGPPAWASRQRSAAATKAAATKAGVPLIQVIGYNTNAFWGAEGKGAELAGKQMGVNVHYVFGAGPSGSNTLMEQAALAAIATHPAGLVLDYLGHFMEPVVLKAEAAGIDVALFNNNRFEAQSGGATTNTAVTGLGFSGQDEDLSGAKLADAFLPFLPKGGGNVLIANAVPQAYVLTLRYNAVNAVLTAAGYKTHYLLLTENGVTDESTIGAYLLAHPNTVGFVGLSGDIETDAAAQWVKAHHLSLPLATFDIDPTTVGLMKSVASFDVALDQQPFLQGYYAVINVVMQIRYGFAPIQMNTGSLIITKQNLPIASKLVDEGVD